MSRFKIERGADGKDIILVHGEPVGVITRPRHGGSYTCTVAGERAKGANGECVPGEKPAWAVKRARQAGLIGAQRLGAPRKRKASDKLRDQERPEVLGFELDRETLTPVRRAINTQAPGDYGCDPLLQPDGTCLFRMVPSGDIVTVEEKRRRLKERG